ncbi:MULTISPECIES: phosphatase PAP2 family protein [Burkholderiaceae]|uniref:phosphatase PAP2 family protein n=1 Tax=Burkholderiaceae TaxID=119060 RepID=UPI0009770AC1|nr:MULTISPECIES: phosphatase PAP2 family protein [Burkholderiaceae]MCG1039076.1 phosphatase PAP2 family protein [Mycetohabitans sp. B7]
MPDLAPTTWALITAFGGAGAMLPVAAAIALWLAVSHTWRSALAWSSFLAAGIALVLVTKVAFLGWGISIRSLDFTGISGHSMLASAVLPAAAFLSTRGAPVMLRLAVLAAGLIAGAAIGVSRVALDAHSVSEVVAGCALGAAVSLGWIAWAATREPNPAARVSRWVVAASLLGLAVSLHSYHAPTHRWVTRIALYLSGHERPFVRVRWKAYRPPILSQALDVQPIDRRPRS